MDARISLSEYARRMNIYVCKQNMGLPNQWCMYFSSKKDTIVNHVEEAIIILSKICDANS